MKNVNQKILKGIMLGLICGIIYGIYPALINIIPYFPKEKNTMNIVTFTMTTVAIIFMFSVLSNILLTGPKKYFSIIKKYFKNKDAWKLSIINLLGTPIGMGFMAVGISLAGGALGKTFVALCIPITALLERFFIKKKFRRLAIFGIIITTLSAIALGIFAINPQDFKYEILIGIIFCLIPAFAWAAQGVLMYKIMHESEIEIKPKEITVLKYSLALVVQLVIILPLLTLINLSPDATYVSMGKLFADYDKSLIILIIAGVALLISYIFYIETTKTLGATMGIVFENLSIIFTPVFIALFFVITRAINPSDESLTNQAIIEDIAHIKTWWFWTFSMTLLIGIVLIVINPKRKLKNIFKKRKKDNDWEMNHHM